MKLVFDIEANGLLDTVSKVHSIVTQDVETKDVWSFNDQCFESLEDGVKYLKSPDVLIGHNIICYDIPVLEKIYPWFNTDAEIIDTLNLSRLIFTNLLEDDARENRIPKRLYGKHSLEAWGHRLNRHKGEYTGGWESWSQEMQDYCEQDVFVNLKLYEYFMSLDYSERAIQIEMDFQKVIHEQQERGVPFDVEKAKEYAVQLGDESEAIKKELVAMYPGFTNREKFIPKRNNKIKNYIAGVPVWKEKFIPFNPGSRQQCLRLLKEQYEWEPTETTDKGNPKLDSETLEKLTFPLAIPISRYYEIKKITGRIVDGKTAWLKLVRNGRISARMVTNGAVTGRATHKGISNIPRVSSYFGRECRSLFHSGSGWMVGADASGLELRILAHYLERYDNGRYINIVTTGDVHTTNQEDAGLPTRDDAKTFIYAFNYGAGDAKIGSIIAPTDSTEVQKRAGKKIKQAFFRKNPAIAELIKDVRQASKRGHLKGLDGRLLHVRADYLALNTLLQSAGAVTMKLASIIAANMLKGIDCYQAIHYHDEMQYIVQNQGDTLTVGEILREAIIRAGEQLGLKCPLDANFKVGKSWADTH